MAAIVKHATTVATADDGTSEVGSNEWNANHVITLDNEAYGPAWNGSTDIPTKNAVYDKIELIAQRTNLVADTTFYVRSTAQPVTISIASPGVVSWSSHGLSINDPVVFSIPEDIIADITLSNGSPCNVTAANHPYQAGDPVKFYTQTALPTGVSQDTKYYVISAGLTSSNFRFSTTVGGAAVNSSSAQTDDAYVWRTGTMPTGIVAGTVYYVCATSFGSNSFTVSATPGGVAINTSGSTEGRIYACTGSDSNDGSAATRTGAFLTVQGAYNYLIEQVDTKGFTATLQLADSEYTDTPQGDGSGNAVLCLTAAWIGGGVVKVHGNDTYPSNAMFNPTGATKYSVLVSGCTLVSYLYLQSLAFAAPGTSGDIISNRGTGTIKLNNVVLGPVSGTCDWWLACRNPGAIIQTQGLTGVEHLGADSFQNNCAMFRGPHGLGPGGCILLFTGGYLDHTSPITVVNNPDFDTFAFVQSGGVFSGNNGGSFNGLFTGPLYDVGRGGSILSSESAPSAIMWTWNTTGSRLIQAGGTYDDYAGIGLGIQARTSQGVVDSLFRPSLKFIEGCTSTNSNYLTITNASSATSVATLSAAGTDTNVDLALIAKGSGDIKFGTFASTASEVITGYITIKDAAGNKRKLAVIA